jgi:hypothetical protein
MSLTLQTNLKLGPVNAKATTQRIGFSITSGCKFNGKYLATIDGALVELGGDTYGGTQIEAYFAPVMTNFGDMRQKRMRYAYLDFEAEDALICKVKTDEQQKKRVTIGRDGQGSSWSVTIQNTNGCDFSVDGIDVMMITRSHGVDSYA